MYISIFTDELKLDVKEAIPMIRSWGLDCVDFRAMVFGKYHDIEVEDDATAIVEYPSRATGVFITTTGEEGIRGLQISNAMHLSAWLGKSVDLPVDEDLYWKKLQEKIAASTTKKAKGADKAMDFEGTF